MRILCSVSVEMLLSDKLLTIICVQVDAGENTVLCKCGDVAVRQVVNHHLCSGRCW